jgi:hypothetical protein
MAQIKGTNVAAPVVPFDTTDVHPSHEARYGKGGYRTVATTVERDAIPAARREAGMLVYVSADGGSLWQLGADLETWTEFASGGVSSWNDLTDRPEVFSPDSHTHSPADILAGAFPADAAYTLSDGTTDSEIGGWGFGVQVTGDADQYAYIEPQAVVVHSAAGSVTLGTTGLTLPNATQLVVGSFDNSTGGANGISLICAVGYELNWQGGRLRNVQLSGDGTPQTIFSDSPIEFTGEEGNVTITGDGIIFPDGTQTTAWTGTVAAEDVTGLATVATSGSYDDLDDLPTLGTAAAAATSDFAAASHNQAWSTITSTPTTLAGYGITDAASSSHTHAQLHDRSHAITSSDHTATAWRVWYSNASGVVTELALGSSGQALISQGASAAPTWGSAGSTSASDLSSGTLANARMTTRARAAMNLYLWSSFR